MALAKQTKPAAPAPVSYISLSPDDATQGGLIDDVDVEIIDAQTCEWDYNGNAPQGPAMAVQMADPNGVTHDQYYSAGKAEDWAPTDNGEGFTSPSGKTGFNNSTNMMKFFASLVECGFPKELLAGGNVKTIIGTRCHVNQIVQERKGLIRTGKNADRPPTTLLVTKIHSLPGADKPSSSKSASTAKAVGGKPNGAATPSKGAAASGTGDPDGIGAKLIEKLTEALAEADNQTLPKKALLPIAVEAYEGNPLKSKAIVMVNNAAFLKSLADHGIGYDGAQFSLGE